MLVKNILQPLRKSTFLRQNAIFFFGSLAVSILNYAYYPILGRLLNLEQYGELQVLTSIFLQLALLLTVLTQVTVSIVANYADEKKKIRVIFELEKLAFWMGGGILFIGLMLSIPLSNALKFESVWPFTILLLAFLATIPLTFRSSYLRGKQDFATVSIGNIIGSAGKIITSLILVLIGCGVAGAIGGIIIAQLLSLAYIATRAHKLGFDQTKKSTYFSIPDIKLLIPELRYALFVLVISLCITLLSTIDVIAVKYYFDAETAGGYAGVATVAKVIFFLTTSVAQVMMPSIKLNQPTAENRAFLYRSFAILGALGGAATLLFMIGPRFIIQIMMGSAYVTYAKLLPLLSLALFVISVVNLIVSYYIALKKYQIAFVVLAGVLVTFVLLGINHTSTAAIVHSLLIGSLSTLALLACWRLSLSARRSHA